MMKAVVILAASLISFVIANEITIDLKSKPGDKITIDRNNRDYKVKLNGRNDWT